MSTRKKKIRGKGRPVGKKLSVGSDALVETTCDLLSKMPPKDVTRAAVAKAAGVDPSLIRYYFKNRSLLLLAAFERLTSEFTSLLEEELASHDSTPEGRLQARVSALFRLNAVYPHYHRLIIDEIVPMNTPESRKVLRNLTADRVNSYRQILKDGQDEGVFREVDTGLMFIAIIGMCHFFTSGSEILKLATGVKSADKKLAAAYQKLVCEVILNGIHTDPGMGKNGK